MFGLPLTATISEIKSKYKELAKLYHPDLNKAADAEDRFKQLGAAYQLLLNATPVVYKPELKKTSRVVITQTIFRILEKPHKGFYTIFYPTDKLESGTRLNFIDMFHEDYSFTEFSIDIDYDIKLPATLKITNKRGEYMIRVMKE